MTGHDARRQYLIQIEGRGRTLSIDDVQKILGPTGVEIDGQYGPILVDPALGRHVVRGWADGEARRRAESLDGVRFFTDARIAPAGPAS